MRNFLCESVCSLYGPALCFFAFAYKMYFTDVFVLKAHHQWMGGYLFADKQHQYICWCYGWGAYGLPTPVSAKVFFFAVCLRFAWGACVGILNVCWCLSKTFCWFSSKWKSEGQSCLSGRLSSWNKNTYVYTKNTIYDFIKLILRFAK